MKLLRKTVGWITIFIVPALLAILVSMLHVFYLDKSPSSFKEFYSASIFTSFKTGELFSGDTIRGEFRAKENNLGIISIRFSTFNRISSDAFTFRIKEKGKKEWYYVNAYKSKEFGGYDLFPFGFPIISKSKDKSYIFELESLRGEPRNAVAIDTTVPSVITTHKFSRGELLSNKKILLQFILKKITLAARSIDIRLFFSAYSFLVFIFILPRLSRVVLRSIKESFLKRKHIAVPRIALPALPRKNIYFVLHNMALWIIIVSSKAMIFVKLLKSLYKYLMKKLLYIHSYLAEGD